jgi:hypothetical protein
VFVTAPGGLAFSHPVRTIVHNVLPFVVMLKLMLCLLSCVYQHHVIPIRSSSHNANDDDRRPGDRSPAPGGGGLLTPRSFIYYHTGLLMLMLMLMILMFIPQVLMRV